MGDRSVERLLEALDLRPGQDGGVQLLHGTSVAAATCILRDGVLIAGEREPRIYFASDPSIAADHDGVEVLVPVRVKAADLVEHNTWPHGSWPPDRAEFLVEGERYPLLAVGKAAFYDVERNAGPGAAWLLEEE